MIASDQIINILEDWGGKSRRDYHGEAVDILNSNKEPFEW